MLTLLLSLLVQDACAISVIEGRIETPTKIHEAVAISDGKVRAIGDSSDMPEVPPTCKTTLAENLTVFPGLTDSHVHLSGVGLREMTLNLDQARSVKDVQVALAAASEAQPEGVIVGRGWIETGWPEKRALNRFDLDDIVPDRPVLLTRADGHAMAVNTAALVAAGIDADTQDPPGGRVVRDADGSATGYLIDAAMNFTAPLMPQMSTERMKEAIRRGAERYAAVGWTAVHNMSVGAAELPLMEELAAEGALPLRVANFVVPEAMEGLVRCRPSV